jgi:hypothetical protein
MESYSSSDDLLRTENKIRYVIMCIITLRSNYANSKATVRTRVHENKYTTQPAVPTVVYKSSDMSNEWYTCKMIH